MKKVVEYCAAVADRSADLLVKVNILINNGWILQGGTSVAANQGVLVFCQALVKYEDDISM